MVKVGRIDMKIKTLEQPKGGGYIAGQTKGVTVFDVQTVRYIYLFDNRTNKLLRKTKSLANGRYIFIGLRPNKKYLVMVRDYKGEGQPYVFDNIVPASDKTVDQQMAMWQSWQ